MMWRKPMRGEYQTSSLSSTYLFIFWWRRYDAVIKWMITAWYLPLPKPACFWMDHEAAIEGYAASILKLKVLSQLHSIPFTLLRIAAFPVSRHNPNWYCHPHELVRLRSGEYAHSSQAHICWSSSYFNTYRCMPRYDRYGGTLHTWCFLNASTVAHMQILPVPIAHDAIAILVGLGKRSFVRGRGDWSTLKRAKWARYFLMGYVAFLMQAQWLHYTQVVALYERAQGNKAPMKWIIYHNDDLKGTPLLATIALHLLGISAILALISFIVILSHTSRITAFSSSSVC